MNIDIFELRDIARELDLANRVVPFEADPGIDEHMARRLARAVGRPACECGEGEHPCEVILTVVDRGTRCKECTVGAHYH